MVLVNSRFPHAKKKKVSENYPQFRHAPSKIFPNPVLGRKCVNNVGLKGAKLLVFPGRQIILACLGCPVCDTDLWNSTVNMGVYCWVVSSPWMWRPRFFERSTIEPASTRRILLETRSEIHVMVFWFWTWLVTLWQPRIFTDLKAWKFQIQIIPTVGNDTARVVNILFVFYNVPNEKERAVVKRELGRMWKDDVMAYGRSTLVGHVEGSSVIPVELIMMVRARRTSNAKTLLGNPFNTKNPIFCISLYVRPLGGRVSHILLAIFCRVNHCSLWGTHWVRRNRFCSWDSCFLRGVRAEAKETVVHGTYITPQHKQMAALRQIKLTFNFV
jgi:hypothetical protein